MNEINSETSLRAAILELEAKRKEEGIMLREQFHLAYESVKPINLIKGVFNQAAASQDVKDNIINRSVGLGAGYLTKVLIEGDRSSPLKRFLGTALMFGITQVVATNPQTVKSIGRGILGILGSKKS